jgi:hypothetical protein
LRGQLPDLRTDRIDGVVEQAMRRLGVVALGERLDDGKVEFE